MTDNELRRFIEGRRRILARRRRGVSVGVVALVALLVVTGGVFAWFNATGSGAATASIGSMSAPGKPSTTVVVTTVHVSWAAATLATGGSSGIKYHVERRSDPGSVWIDACGSSSASPISGTSCDDSPGAGTFVYRVTAQFASWTAVGPESDPVTAEIVATKLVFLTSPVTTTAGVTSGTIRIERQDASGTPGTAGNATITLSSSAGTGIFRNGADTSTITAVSIPDGSSDASFKYRDTTAGGPIVTLTDAPDGLTQATQTETIAPAAASALRVTGYPASTVAGVSHTFTVTAKDQFGNTDTNYSGTVHFSATNDAQGILPADSGLLAGTGTFSATFKTVAGGSKSLSATDTLISSVTGSEGGISVTPATASTLAFSTQPAGATAGSAFTQQPVVKTQDQFGNNSAVGLGASRTVTLAIASGTGSLQGTATMDIGTTSGNGTVTFTNLRIDAAGAKTLSATAAAGSPTLVTAASTSFTVNPTTVSQLAFATQPGGATAGSAFTQQPVVKTQDQFGNDSTVGLGPSRNVTIAIASGGGTLQGSATLDIGTGAGNGTVIFTNLRIDQAGAKTLSATATAVSPTLTSGTSSSFTVSASTATTIAKTAGDNQSIPINNAAATAFKVAITDAFSNPVPGVTVTFGAPGSGASGTFAGGVTTATTAADGTATAAAFTANGTAGGYTVSATAAGAGSVNFSVTNYGSWVWAANGTAQSWTSSSAKSVTYPTGTASGDLLLLALVQNNNTAAPTITGWTQLQTVNKGNTIRLTVYWRAAGSETSVSVTPANSGAAWVVDYKRSFGPAPALAGAATTSSGNGSTTIVAPAITTTGVNATVVSVVGIPAANTLSLSTAQSFTLRAALTTSTPGTAFGLADRSVAATGGVTGPTWAQTVGNADWALVTGAFD